MSNLPDKIGISRITALVLILAKKELRFKKIVYFYLYTK